MITSNHRTKGLGDKTTNSPQRIEQGVVTSKSVYAGMASIPRRAGVVEEVIESIYDQFDGIFIHLNNYGKVPDVLRDSKIYVSRSQDLGDLKDTGKFAGLRHVGNDAFYFSVDDDIIYPPDYRNRMLATLQSFGNAVLLGVHAAIYQKNEVSFFNRQVFHFTKPAKVDFPVSVVGTGTAAFHTGKICPEFDWFPTHGMADITIARELNLRKIPRVAIAREQDWLFTPQCLEGERGTLFEATRKSDAQHTEILRDGVTWGVGEIEASLEATFGQNWQEKFDPSVDRMMDHFKQEEISEPAKMHRAEAFLASLRQMFIKNR